LGVRYVLEGSVHKSRDHVRITAQLIETSTGAHLWADHFDGFLEDVFELQDKSGDERCRRNRARITSRGNLAFRRLADK
jgi:TolB-like protein